MIWIINFAIAFVIAYGLTTKYRLRLAEEIEYRHKLAEKYEDELFWQNEEIIKLKRYINESRQNTRITN